MGTQFAMIEETPPAQQKRSTQAIVSTTIIRRLIDPAPAGSPAPGECFVIMPGPGDAVHEGTVIRWLKEEGEHVEAAEALLQVSDGMTSTEILSPAAASCATSPPPRTRQPRWARSSP